MYRFISFLLSLATGAAASWYVYINLNEIVARWIITIAFSASVLIAVTLLLYLPLLKHMADLVEEKFSTAGARLTGRKTGVNLNDIPQINHSRRSKLSANNIPCGMCGGPGGPVCEKCRKKMSKI